jgi:hypothetical protein
MAAKNNANQEACLIPPPSKKFAAGKLNRMKNVLAKIQRGEKMKKGVSSDFIPL